MGVCLDHIHQQTQAVFLAKVFFIVDVFDQHGHTSANRACGLAVGKVSMQAPDIQVDAVGSYHRCRDTRVFAYRKNVDGVTEEPIDARAQKRAL